MAQIYSALFSNAYLLLTKPRSFLFSLAPVLSFFILSNTNAQAGTLRSIQKFSDTLGGFTGGLSNCNLSIPSIGDLGGNSMTELVVGTPYDVHGGSCQGAVYPLFLVQGDLNPGSQSLGSRCMYFKE